MVAQPSHPRSGSREFSEPPIFEGTPKNSHGVQVPNETKALKPAEVWCNLSSGAEMVPPGVILSRLELLESPSCIFGDADLGTGHPQNLNRGK